MAFYAVDVRDRVIQRVTNQYDGVDNKRFFLIEASSAKQAWAKAGLPLETGAAHMASPPEDVVLSARERGQGREEAMREYLAWEIDLVNQMATDDDHRFRVVSG